MHPFPSYFRVWEVNMAHEGQLLSLLTLLGGGIRTPYRQVPNYSEGWCYLEWLCDSRWSHVVPHIDLNSCCCLQRLTCVSKRSLSTHKKCWRQCCSCFWSRTLSLSCSWELYVCPLGCPVGRVYVAIVCSVGHVYVVLMCYSLSCRSCLCCYIYSLSCRSCLCCPNV